MLSFVLHILCLKFGYAICMASLCCTVFAYAGSNLMQAKGIEKEKENKKSRFLPIFKTLTN